MTSAPLHRRTFLALSGALAATAPAWARTAESDKWARDFGAYVADNLALTQTPGLSVAAVRGGRIVYSAGFSYADVETARPVTPDTIFQIASVSKTVTATALMLLAQDGAFRLDDPIAPHLDFAVVHPKFPGDPITFRHLFTHTSGISDAVYNDLDFSGAPVPPLRDFLAAYLVPGGRWYDAAKCYGADKPGAAWSYSNVGAALLGYLAQRVAPDTLDAITAKRLFAPLGLRNTAWRYEGVTDARLAQPYEFQAAHYRRLPRNAYPDWPAGLLCTSANDFAKFLSIYTQADRGPLKPATISQMFTPDPVPVNRANPSIRQGLIWELTQLEGSTVALHLGGDPGAATIVAVDAANTTAALAFANVTPHKAILPFQKELIRRLLDRARTA